MLVFEYLEYDLKKYMSKINKEVGMDLEVIKVLALLLYRALLISCYRELIIAIKGKFYIEISSLKTFSFLMIMCLKLQILDWQGHQEFQQRAIPMKSSLSGIGLLMFCWVLKNTPIPLTFGQLAASLLKWST